MTDSLTAWNLLAILLPTTLVGLAVYVWTALALGAVLAKLGVARWKAWVPVYNGVVVLGLGGLSGWLLLLLLIPVFGPVFVYVALVTAAHRIGTAFGCGAGMTVLAALLFPVWASVLGVGAARPVEPLPARSARVDDGGDLLSFSAQFERGTGDEDLSARRSVPSPSAWIPPIAPTGVAAAPPTAPVATTSAGEEPHRAAPEPLGAPYPPLADVPAVAEYATPAASAQAAAGTPAPAAAETFAPVPEPAAPVMSWWQPAIVDETDEPDADVALADIPDWARPVSSAPVEAAPAPAPVPEHITPVAEPITPVAEPAPAALGLTRSPEPAAAFATPAVLRESRLPESDGFPESSGEVSAVVGSPIAGPPRAAATPDAAVRAGAGDFVEDTVIASRRRPKWALALPDGSTLDLSGDTAVLGRRPAPVHSAPGAQLVVVIDDTRTVSKTHALLRRRAEAWMVSDLGSTNGVVVVEGGTEVEVAPGADHEVGETFLLGDAVLRLVRTDA